MSSCRTSVSVPACRNDVSRKREVFRRQFLERASACAFSSAAQKLDNVRFHWFISLISPIRTPANRVRASCHVMHTDVIRRIQYLVVASRAVVEYRKNRLHRPNSESFSYVELLMRDELFMKFVRFPVCPSICKRGHSRTLDDAKCT